ncbi:TPA: hypothetical protein ACG04H_005019, partial [Escherichia coli]
GMIMPVTKCEPETTRKASRKSAKTQETVLSALLAQTEEVSVPLSAGAGSGADGSGRRTSERTDDALRRAGKPV